MFFSAARLRRDSLGSGVHMQTFVLSLQRSVVLSGFLGLAACGPTCDCLTPASGTVTGHVTTTGGAAIAGATVLGYLAPPNGICSVGAEAGLATSGSTGQFSLEVVYGMALDSACVFVKVRPPQGSALRDTLVGPLRLGIHYTAPFDSAVVNVRLAP